jgi:hypothetical protein
MTLRFFSFEHLPLDLQEVSRKFHELANWMQDALPANEQRAVAFQKLLEAKDAAVRARVSND